MTYRSTRRPLMALLCLAFALPAWANSHQPPGPRGPGVQPLPRPQPRVLEVQPRTLPPTPRAGPINDCAGKPAGCAPGGGVQPNGGIAVQEQLRNRPTAARTAKDRQACLQQCAPTDSACQLKCNTPARP